MAKFASDDVLDAALMAVAAADRLVVLAGQPADYAAAMAGRLAQAALTPADYALAAGSGGGRRLTVAAKTGLIAEAGGTADHVGLLDTAGERLLYVTTCPPQPLVSGGGVSVAAWQVEIGAPL